MPTNLHAFAAFLRTLYIERANAQLGPMGTHPRLLAGGKHTTAKLGIHLRAPTEVDLFDAIERAERDGFEVIYVYPN